MTAWRELSFVFAAALFWALSALAFVFAVWKQWSRPEVRAYSYHPDRDRHWASRLGFASMIGAWFGPLVLAAATSLFLMKEFDVPKWLDELFFVVGFFGGYFLSYQLGKIEAPIREALLARPLEPD